MVTSYPLTKLALVIALLLGLAFSRPTESREIIDGRSVCQIDDLKRFYLHQDDGLSCSAFSMGMLYSDQVLGRPLEYGEETEAMKKLAGVTKHGYRGNLESIACKLRKKGLQAKAFHYKHFDQYAVSDLNRQLDEGHSAVARVINPHTNNRHYIYIAGRNAAGDYIIGDPDRKNADHFQPVKSAHLLSMMSGRDGFVAGWK
jgi:hypothetical protein